MSAACAFRASASIASIPIMVGLNAFIGFLLSIYFAMSVICAGFRAAEEAAHQTGMAELSTMCSFVIPY